MGEEKVLYSVKMRSSLGGTHGVGGQHISGAERIVTKNSVEQEMISMLHRAWEHDRGAADLSSSRWKRSGMRESPAARFCLCTRLTRQQRRKDGRRRKKNCSVPESVKPLWGKDLLFWNR